VNAVDPRDRADEALVEALLHRFADPRDLSREIRAALARTDAPRGPRRRWLLHALFMAAAAAVTVLVLLLAKGGTEAERYLDRAIERAGSGGDQEYRIGVPTVPIEGRLLLRPDQRMLLEVRGPRDTLAFRAGIGREGAWTIAAGGRVEAGALADFGADHPLVQFHDLVVRSLVALRGAPDLELVRSETQPDLAALRSAREGLQVTVDGRTGEVERLEVPWLVGRLDLVRQPSGQKQDLVYEHASYHAPSEVVNAPAGEFSLSSLFGFGDQFSGEMRDKFSERFSAPRGRPR
jgi:hypothetical protein